MRRHPKYLTALTFANIQLYPLVSHAPKHIREACYELLTAYIKKAKERIEIEAALAPNGELDRIPGLPEELLSIVLDEPENPDADGFRRDDLEGYLMSWSLLFEHFVDGVIT